MKLSFGPIQVPREGKNETEAGEAEPEKLIAESEILVWEEMRFSEPVMKLRKPNAEKGFIIVSGFFFHRSPDNKGFVWPFRSW